MRPDAGELLTSYKVLGRPPVGSMERRRRDLLHDLKWWKLLARAGWFRFLPFIEFVMVSGSMALGNVTEKSDFDLLVGVRNGRMFTARYFALALFTLLGLRRINDDPKSSPDKFCFNHFVTEHAYSKPPYNAYRRELYRNLVPIAGDPERIRAFFKANGWCGRKEDALDLRYRYPGKNAFARFLEFLLGGHIGDFLEIRIATPIAKRRLQKYVSKEGSGGRVVVTDEELEFHFHLPYEEGLVPLEISRP